MKYNNIELEEMSSEDWNGKTRQMLVWNGIDDSCHLAYVVGYKHTQTTKNGFIEYDVVWLCSDGYYWSHCAEIPEEPNQEQNVDEMIKVLNAYKEGKRVECRFKDRTMRDSWSYMEKPDWNWALYEYRVEQESRRMTNKELKEWLKKNCGQYFVPSPNSFINGYVRTQFGYGLDKDDELVKEGIQIRAWYESEWHEPMIEE